MDDCTNSSITSFENSADPATTPSSIDELDEAIVTLSRGINQANYRLLVLVREFDERAGWRQWGSTSCADWLHWRCDISVSAARERVRIAHSLKGLHRIAAAFEAGDLSYSKVRAMTRVATPDDEESLLAFAMKTTAARVEECCRQRRNVEKASVGDANRAHAGRSLQSWCDVQRGVTVITVTLPVERAEVVLAAVDRAVEAERCESGPEFGDVSWSAQRADALVAVASDFLGGGTTGGGADAALQPDGVGASPQGLRASSADRYQVIVHVDETALREGKGRSDFPIESVRRLLCDGSVVTMGENARGEPLDIGRKRRTISAAIRRALWARDRGCTFPGCTNKHFIDAHHIEHWAGGGETSLDNLCLLCSAHHRLVHEGGYEIHRDSGGDLYFRRPDGRAVPNCGFPAHLVARDTSAEVRPSVQVNDVRGEYSMVFESDHLATRDTSAEVRPSVKVNDVRGEYAVAFESNQASRTAIYRDRVPCSH